MKQPSSASETDTDRSELARQLNLKHPLVQLAESIDWPSFEAKFGRVLDASGGRPPLPTRLMVGLHYLKAMYDGSDESVVAKWVENQYWQYFCGEQTFQHDLPCHPTSLVKWRQQVGPEGIEQLLGGVLRSAMSTSMLQPRDIEKVNVDTTVQEKAIAFPTDARLYQQARITLELLRNNSEYWLASPSVSDISRPLSDRSSIIQPRSPSGGHQSLIGDYGRCLPLQQFQIPTYGHHEVC